MHPAGTDLPEGDSLRAIQGLAASSPDVPPSTSRRTVHLFDAARAAQGNISDQAIRPLLIIRSHPSLPTTTLKLLVRP